jgi:molybdopterin adenylyltransferase
VRWKAAILTTGAGGEGEHEDTSAQVIRELVEEELKGAVIDYRIVPREMDEIMAALIEMSDYHEADLILTVGGIGLAPRDLTPEATRQVIDKEVPGLAEAMRSQGLLKSPSTVWQRGIAGVRGRTLIVNLPESPKGVHESLNAIMPQLPVGLTMITETGGNAE